MKTVAPLSILALASPSVAEAYADHTYSSVKGGVASWLYDWGIFGSYPRIRYESFKTASPQVNHIRKDDRCDDGLIFMTPYGSAVDSHGPVILDNDGNLVWTQASWGRTADFKVQKIAGESYITFWHDTPTSVGEDASGQGVYAILDHSYRLVKEVRPAGGLAGDFHEFKLTDDGTALITVSNRTTAQVFSYGVQPGWVLDSVFQEVNITTGDLLFEWKASNYFTVENKLTNRVENSVGAVPDSALDFFHINSVDKDKDGNYLVSSANLKRVLCVSSKNGAVLWQLGGEENSFRDLSRGAATWISRTSDVKWHDESTIMLFDSGFDTRSSRGMVVEVNNTSRTATLVHEYPAPGGKHTQTDGSVQSLPNGNILVGWGDVPSFTEFAEDGQVLCDTHMGPVTLSKLGWVRNYRTYKFPWVGKPQTYIDVAVRPRENAVYVSWNGATEVTGWMLDAFFSEESKAMTASHEGRAVVEKDGFETRINIPRKAAASIRVAALDKNGNILGYSKPVFKDVETPGLHFSSPLQGGERKPEAATVLCALLGVTLISIGGLICSRWILGTWRSCVRRRREAYEYRTLAKDDKGLV